MNKQILFLFFIGFIVQPITAQTITSTQIANLEYDLIPAYELPKQYLLDGRTRTYPAENAFRRMDIVYFLSIPITFYLFYNLIQLINVANVATGNFNAALQRDTIGFTSSEWNFILMATFLIPSGVAIYDYVYVRDYPLLPPFDRAEFREVRMTFTVFRTRF
ncbi:MAG: hypothetical protein ACRCY4_05950 [Brevinema sp.]